MTAKTNIVCILVAVTLLTITVFGGNCECDPDECLDECRCGNASSTQECSDCVSACEPKDEDCSNLGFILYIIGHVITVLGFLGYCKWCSRNEEVKDKEGFCYKWTIKLIFLVLSIAGISGLVYFRSCDCDDPWDCNSYSAGQLTCESFGGDECYWDGYSSCKNNTCVCCKLDLTDQIVTAFSWIAGVEGVGGGIIAILMFIKGFCCDAKKVNDQNHYKEMDSYEY